MVTAENAIQNAVSEFVAFVPQLIGAIAILVIGWIAGRAIGRIVRVIVARSEIDRLTMRTPLGRVAGGSEQAVSKTFGKLAKWFVYALAVLAAADVLAIQLLSQWVSAAVSYLPAFLGGLAIIVGGFIVSDFIGDMIERTEQATRTWYTEWVANGVRLFLYFTVIVIGLETMGVNVGFLYVIAGAVSTGIALAVAIGVGVAVGLGAQDYVRENIDRWVQRGREETE